MKKILSVIISGACACCLVSCKDSGSKTNLLVLPLSTGAAVSTGAADRTWVQDAYLKASNATTDTGYGSSVAIGGDTIAVGAQSVSSTQTTITNTDGAADTSVDLPAAAVSAGAVYVYKKDAAGNWIQDAYLRPSNANAFEMFGCSVAVSGDIIVAGAHWDYTHQSIVTNDDGHPTWAESPFDVSPSGAAYVFKKNASGNWYQDAFLKASNAGQDNFGNSVAVDGETIVVGAYTEGSDNTIVTNSNNGHPTVGESNDLAAGAGAAYVFKKDTSGVWYQDAFLKASNAGANDYFGWSVSISGDIIAVGAYQEDSNATGITNLDSSHADPGTAADSGAVYVFKRNATTGDWSQDAYFKASNGGAGDNFGMSVAVNGNTIVVGAKEEDSWSPIINSNGCAESNEVLVGSGAVYVFKRDTTTGDWSQDAFLKASNAGMDDAFGSSVAVYGNTIVVGTSSEDSGQNAITNTDGIGADDDSMSFSGAVYVFKKDTSGNWVQDAYLKASNHPENTGLGSRVAISGTTIVSGAGSEGNTTRGIVNNDGHPTAAECSFGTLNVGAAYVFTVK